VVVGAGAAGSVVAARLAQAGAHSVVLCEAGPDLRDELPAEVRDGWGLPQIPDWGYASEPKPGGDPQKLRRGKLVGGTSWLTRFAVRGSPADFDDWAAAANPGWSFEEVLPDFNRLESDAEFGRDPWHGAVGPIPITRYPNVASTDVAAAAEAAMAAVGFARVDDHNRPRAVGVGRMPMSSVDGVRVTSSQAYLAPDGVPPNLTVRPNAQVADVVLDGDRVRGVRLTDGTVVAARCVVLSAGTYGSPSILMRSGIGPAEHLRSLGISTRVDLPGVGANLADHSEIDIDSGYRGVVRATPALHTIATFHSTGELTSGPPDLMLWLPDPFQAPDGPPIFEIEVLLMKPRSRGRVRLRSADPTDAPRIDLPSLQDPYDVRRLAEAYTRALEVANRGELRGLCVDQAKPILSGQDLVDWIRSSVYSMPHVVGTCAMGPSPGDGSVVDASGRVHGVESLYVADASIIPDAPSGFPHLITMMLAERLAPVIAASL